MSWSDALLTCASLRRVSRVIGTTVKNQWLIAVQQEPPWKLHSSISAFMDKSPRVHGAALHAVHVAKEFGNLLAKMIGIICLLVWIINYKQLVLTPGLPPPTVAVCMFCLQLLGSCLWQRHFFDPVHGSVVKGSIAQQMPAEQVVSHKPVLVSGQGL